MKTKFILALCLAGSIGYAQSISPHVEKNQIVTYPTIFTIAGNGTGGFAGDGGPATASQIASYCYGIGVDPSNADVYIGDQFNNRVRKIHNGIINTIAGTGTAGYSGDGGQATLAKVNNPQGIAIDANGNIYIADYANARIRKINSSGIISTIAGTGTAGYSGDGGQASLAKINGPSSISIDASGNIFICDVGNSTIRKITVSTGIITTIAGNGTAGYSGDGGAASAALINAPEDIAIDPTGNLFIADQFNHRVRKITASSGQITPSCIISTIVGNGTAGFSGDWGAATAATINNPAGVATDGSGNLFVSDRYNHYIRKVNAISGQVTASSTITPYGGNGTAGSSGDCGVSTAAQLNYQFQLETDAAGNVYVADGTNSRIRELSYYCLDNAGPNQTNQQDVCGSWSPGVTIGTPGNSCLTYAWSPNTNLSSTTSATTTSTYSTTLSSQTLIYTLTVSGSSCLTNTATVQVTAIKTPCPSCCREMNSIAQHQITPGFVIYPNPSKNQATIRLYDKADYISVTDINGRMIFSIKDIVESEYVLDVSQYSKGIYLLTVKIGDVYEKQKLFIE